MPTFAFPIAPIGLTLLLLRNWNAPLPPFFIGRIHSFGTVFDARVSSTLGRSTSELLRTL